MKFRMIFIIFNVFIVLSFAIISLVPLFVLGMEYAQMFWSKNWIVSLLFVLFIGGLDVYFIMNWKLFNLLEKENWPALISFLEEQIYVKNRFTKRNISILINAYLSVSNLEKSKKLEVEIRSKAAKQMNYFALYLGTPYLLESNLNKAAEYFKEFADIEKIRFREWIRWSYAFSMVSEKKVEESRNIFIDLLKTTKDPVLQLLTLYLTDNMTRLCTEEEKNFIRDKNSEFKTSYGSRKEWEKLLAKSVEDNLLILLLSSLIRNAYDIVTGSSPSEK